MCIKLVGHTCSTILFNIILNFSTIDFFMPQLKTCFERKILAAQEFTDLVLLLSINNYHAHCLIRCCLLLRAKCIKYTKENC